MHTQRTRSWIALAAGLLAAVAAAPAADAASLAVGPGGPQETVFSWKTARCEDWDIPDAAARAWRDQQDQVHLVASAATARQMVGPDLDHLRRDCKVVFRGAELAQPERYDDKDWLAATWSPDGGTVFALVHQEFQGHRRPGLCPSGVYRQCWRNALTLAISRDAGGDFAPASPRHLVAGLPYRYRGDAGHPTGYFSPSNIIARDGYYYAFFWAEAEGAQRRGACLMRTASLADAGSWRAWGGTDFTVRFADPYHEDASDAERHVCAPVGENVLVSVSSVVRLRGPGGYVAVMATSRAPAEGGAAVTGIFASSSADLIRWTPPVLVQRIGILSRFDCAERNVAFYPSLLDPASPSRNFEDVGERPYLYLTEIHPEACRIGADRDLVRLRVRIQLAPT